MRSEEELKKRRDYMREWYKHNSEKVKSWAKRYRATHQEEHRIENRAYMARVRAADPSKLLRDRQKYRDRDPERYLFLHARTRAKKIGVVFTITRDDIVLPEFCPVLGIKLEWGIGQRASANRNSPSVDRIIPELGYVPGNVLVISNRANFLKNDAEPEELLLVAEYTAREFARVRRELG